jgi:hypothetical protein
MEYIMAHEVQMESSAERDVGNRSNINILDMPVASIVVFVLYIMNTTGYWIFTCHATCLILTIVFTHATMTHLH